MLHKQQERDKLNCSILNFCNIRVKKIPQPNGTAGFSNLMDPLYYLLS
jgi:hypothetical protein